MSKLGRRKSSGVWEHFSQPDGDNNCVCNHCKVVLSYCNSTGSLLKHLRSKHPFADVSISATCSTSTSSSSFSLKEDTQPAKKYQKRLDTYLHQPVTPLQAKRITKLIQNVIVGDLRPINMVEGHNFKLLLKHLAPGYDLPGRMTFTRNITDMCMKIKTKLTEILSRVKHMSLTTDLWSSVRQQSYLGVTVHFIESDSTEVKHFVLAAKEVVDAHTGNNIAEWIESIIESYGLSPTQIISIVSDNGTNMVRACQLLNTKHSWIHVRCAAHTLQLCVHDACDLPQIKAAIVSARHLVSYFRQSNKAATALRTLQQQSDEDKSLELLLDVPTRWNSTLAMISRLCKLQWLARQVICDDSMTSRSKAMHLELRDAHWLILQQLVLELEPLKVATDFIEGSNYVTVAGVVPLIKGLAAKYSNLEVEVNIEIQPAICQFRHIMLKSLQRRFKHVFISDGDNQSPSMFDISTWLHPMYKAKYFKKAYALQVKAKIESQSSASSVSVSAADVSVAQEASTSLMDTLFDLGVEQPEQVSSDESLLIDDPIVKEISMYLKEKSEICEDMLKWWDIKKQKYPLLYAIALKYMCVPASSAASERCFSTSGLTANCIRSRLTGEHLEALTILHCNKDLLQQIDST